MKAIVLVAGLAATLALPAGGVDRVSAAAHPAAVPRTCQHIQLAMQPQSSQGAAGHIAVNYRIHNLFGQACTLYGYPGVQLLNRQFLTLPTTVHRGDGFLGSIPRRLVRLGAYGNAYFTLIYSDVPTNNQPCPTARYLMIWAPNNFLPVVTYAFTGGGTIMPCGGVLTVSPVTSQPRF